MEFKKFSVGLNSYGSDDKDCLDAKKYGVTNFNFHDESYYERN